MIDGVRSGGSATRGRQQDQRARQQLKRRKQARDAAIFKEELERINKEHGYG